MSDATGVRLQVRHVVAADGPSLAALGGWGEAEVAAACRHGAAARVAEGGTRGPVRGLLVTRPAGRVLRLLHLAGDPAAAVTLLRWAVEVPVRRRPVAGWVDAGLAEAAAAAGGRELRRDGPRALFVWRPGETEHDTHEDDR